MTAVARDERRRAFRIDSDAWRDPGFAWEYDHLIQVAMESAGSDSPTVLIPAAVGRLLPEGHVRSWAIISIDDNEQAQKRLQREQDGSEVKSVQLETLIDIGQGLIDRRESMELFRETAADLFLKATGTHWSPRSGSRTSHRHLTAAMIDSRDFIAAKKRAETESLVPPGPKVAFSGGDTTDHRLIWDRLDQIHAKHPDMVLLHGGSPKGAERIAATWASNRKVPQVAFKPDWTKHAKAAPFKRNDQMLDCMPIGVVVFPGTGIQDNLADKARKMGIPVYRMATGSA